MSNLKFPRSPYDNPNYVFCMILSRRPNDAVPLNWLKKILFWKPIPIAIWAKLEKGFWSKNKSQ